MCCLWVGLWVVVVVCVGGVVCFGGVGFLFFFGLFFRAGFVVVGVFQMGGFWGGVDEGVWMRGCG